MPEVDFRLQELRGGAGAGEESATKQDDATVGYAGMC